MRVLLDLATSSGKATYLYTSMWENTVYSRLTVIQMTYNNEVTVQPVYMKYNIYIYIYLSWLGADLITVKQQYFKKYYKLSDSTWYL